MFQRFRSGWRSWVAATRLRSTKVNRALRSMTLASFETDPPSWLELDSWQTTLAQLIQHEPRKAYTISPEAFVLEAVRKMVTHNVGALAVVESERETARSELRLVGVFTERDYLRKIIVASRASRDTTVAQVMTRELVCVTPQQRVGDALQLMVEHDIRHLPVLERLPDGPLVTMVSMRQLMHQVAENHEKQVTALMAQLRKLALIVVDDKDSRCLRCPERSAAGNETNTPSDPASDIRGQ